MLKTSGARDDGGFLSVRAVLGVLPQDLSSCDHVPAQKSTVMTLLSAICSKNGVEMLIFHLGC